MHIFYLVDESFMILRYNKITKNIGGIIMSRSIIIVFIFLLVITAIFAYFNYNRLHQMQSDLLKREALLEHSEQLAKRQEESLSQLEEKMKEISEKKDISSEEKEVELQGQLDKYQQELLEFRLKVDELIQERKSDTEGIVLLSEEKAKLETLLADKEDLWIVKEEESRRIIASLQKEIEKYESESKLISDKLLNIEKYLESEQLKRKELEQGLVQFEGSVHLLQEQLALRSDDEKYVQQISQLQFNKEQLEQDIAKKNSDLLLFQQEYKEIAERLTLYQEQIEELKKELVNAKEKVDVLRNEQLIKMQKEKEVLEKTLADKQEIWDKQNKENRQLVSYLQERLEDYKKEVELVRIDSSLFREEIAAQIELQQQSLKHIREREDQISLLASQIEQYTEKIENYERTIAEIRARLKKQEDISFQDQQNLMDTIRTLVEERDESQTGINQLYAQISSLEAEIVELVHKIGLLEEKDRSKYYEVKSGDNLWNIARSKYKEGIAWVKIFSANQDQIANPDLIYPYQKFALPD